MSDLVAPVTYQGGKQRLADRIIAHLGLGDAERFNDLCCGSGAVSIAAVNAGYDPRSISMVDLSPWGLFWRAIGSGEFDVDHFRRVMLEVPSDPRGIKLHVETLYNRAVDPARAVYDFLILQGAAIGGSAVRIDGGRWRRSSGFRDYWLPTATSSRRSPVNPMMPMPDTICERVSAIAERMRGVTACCADASTFAASIKRGVVYIDPPYGMTTGYGYTMDAGMTARSLSVPCWVSEGRAMSDGAVRLSGGEAKGGVTGNRKRTPQEEWLSPFNLEPKP